VADDVRSAIRRQRAAVIAFGDVWADRLLGEAQRIVPLEEGTLAASGDVRRIDHSDRVEWIVSFSTPYAARRHEELTAQIKVAGRQAKYLEEPAKRLAPAFNAGVAAAARKAAS